MKKFLGLQYPLVKTVRGTMAQKNGVDQIKADLLQLLLTNPGERVMLPEFGTPLRKLMFEQNDSILELTAKQMIAKAITTWEPRIVVTDITVTSKFDPSKLNKNDDKSELESIIGISINFVDPENISKIESLKLELPIGG